MRCHVTLVLILLLAGTASIADQFIIRGDGPTFEGDLQSSAPIQFTQNYNVTAIFPVQVACGIADTYTAHNWYLRRFLLSVDHGIVEPLIIHSVDFAIEQIEMADGSVPPDYDVDVVLFESQIGSPDLFANMVEINRVTTTLTPADVGTIKNTDIGGLVSEPTANDLWVAIEAHDGSGIGAGLQFRPGANNFGAMRDAYVAAASCGFPDQIHVSAIGFPDSQTIFVVNGDTVSVTGVEDTGLGQVVEGSWGQIKALFR
jgi:hypothetical protein